MCIPLTDTFTDKVRMHTKAASKMLIRRLDTIKKLVAKYDLSMDVTLVTLNCNLADN